MFGSCHSSIQTHLETTIGARSEFFFFWGGVASRVPWGWRDSYGKTEIFLG